MASFSRICILIVLLPAIFSLSVPNLTRRDIFTIGGIATNFVNTAQLANAEEDRDDDDDALGTIRSQVTKPNQLKDETIDISKINAARSNTFSNRYLKSVIPMDDPPPNILIAGKGDSVLRLPRVGYSLYKTPSEQVARGTLLALKAGIKHFDIGSDYGTNEEVAKALRHYLNVGLSGLNLSTESPELLEFLDMTRTAGEQRALTTEKLIAPAIPAPDGLVGRNARRNGIFIHYKLSNSEQSTSQLIVKRTVKKAMADFGTYFDMVSLHSPLTSSEQRLTTYSALLELRNEGFIRSVGVCNYGVGALKELQSNNLDFPSSNQLEISPFNTHDDVVKFCSNNRIVVSCSAWSKLSSTPAIEKGWDVVREISSAKGMTKAQVLVRWALQKGFVCVPRSATKSKLERKAIAENSYGGVNVDVEGTLILTNEEMKMLDNLDVKLSAGNLGRRDGWNDSDVSSAEWDPTFYV